MADERIVPISLHQEMQRSYLEYAMSVIVGRALPDVRDGLKPVQRRILYAMHELGLTPDRPYRKCARVVGDVLGKYHPHGDQAVYDALVRQVQTFGCRHPLLDGHGNFGSVDDDPPAAMRYTETRLAPISHQGMLEEIGNDTVFKGSDRRDVTGCSSQHTLRLGTDGFDRFLAIVNSDSHNGRLIKNDAAILYVDQCVGRAEVDRQIG